MSSRRFRRVAGVAAAVWLTTWGALAVPAGAQEAQCVWRGDPARYTFSIVAADEQRFPQYATVFREAVKAINGDLAGELVISEVPAALGNAHVSVEIRDYGMWESPPGSQRFVAGQFTGRCAAPQDAKGWWGLAGGVLKLNTHWLDYYVDNRQPQLIAHTAVHELDHSTGAKHVPLNTFASDCNVLYDGSQPFVRSEPCGAQAGKNKYGDLQEFQRLYPIEWDWEWTKKLPPVDCCP